MNTPGSTPQQVDAIVVGAGFAGMYAVHSLRQRGFTVLAFERGHDVGGVWYWNRYPGCRCDIDSMEYSYSFSEDLQQEWEWSERFASQPEILRYAQHVADRFDLRQDIRFGVEVVSATFDETRQRWLVRTSDGVEVSARYLLLCVGCLSNAAKPDIAGLEDFRGDAFHTGLWPEEGVDVDGKRVGVIGTGSSGVQVIPQLARSAAQLTVFQRTATYTVPARNRPLDPEYVQRIKSDYAGFRARNLKMIGAAGADRLRPEPTSIFDLDEEERDEAFMKRWQHGGMGLQATFPDLRANLDANAYLADFMRRQIGKTVTDARKADILTPQHVAGCKRMCLDSGYYEAFNRETVDVVDVSRNPIERFAADGLVVGGNLYPLDIVVFATGYDAMTGAMLAIDIKGRGGQSLREAWAAGPRTFLGLSTAGFPNLFIVAGPGSPSVLSNMVIAAEQHVDWIAECLDYLRRHNIGTIEATESAQDAWVAHVNSIAEKTLYTQCNSWYLGANIPGKPRVFMPLIGFPAYVDKCNEVAESGYEPFVLHHE